MVIQGWSGRFIAGFERGLRLGYGRFRAAGRSEPLVAVWCWTERATSMAAQVLGPSGDGTFLAEWWQSDPRRQGSLTPLPNAPLTVPVFIWTLQFYKTYYSDVFYF